jgi:hypothetical protein
MSCVLLNRITRPLTSNIYVFTVIANRTYARNRAVKSSRQVLSSRNNKRIKSIDELVKPVILPINKPSDASLTDFEGSEALTRDAISAILLEFSKNETIREMAEENGITSTPPSSSTTSFFNKIYLNFRQYCLNVDALDSLLKVTLSDIINHGINSIFLGF